jgi:hypothetical protein
LGLVVALSGAILALATGAYPAKSEEVINSIRDISRALRACWEPPHLGEQNAVAFAVRVSFRGNGEVLGRPFVFFQTRNVTETERQAYRMAVQDMLHRCTPMHFSPQLAAGIAGHPITIRVIQGRSTSISA